MQKQKRMINGKERELVRPDIDPVDVSLFYKDLNKSKSAGVKLARHMVNDKNRLFAFSLCLDQSDKRLGAFVMMLRNMGTFLAEGKRLAASSLAENRNYVDDKAKQVEKAAAMQRHVIQTQRGIKQFQP